MNNTTDLSIRHDLKTAVSHNDVEQVADIVQQHPGVDKYTAVFEAIKHQRKDCFGILLNHFTADDRTAIYEEGGLLLYSALETKQFDVFQALFEMVGADDLTDGLFYAAIRAGNEACFQLLEPHLPSQMDNAVLWAVECGRVAFLPTLLQHYGVNSHAPLRKAIFHPRSDELIELLAPYSSADRLHSALCEAVGVSLGCVPQLAALCDPKSKDSEALFLAVTHIDFGLAEILAPLSEPSVVLHRLNEVGDYPAAQMWLEEWMAHDLNTRMIGVIDSGVATPARKM